MERRGDRGSARGAGHSAGAGARRAHCAGTAGLARRRGGRSSARQARVPGRPVRLSAFVEETSMSDPALLSLADAREVPHRELVQACRARIREWQPRLNAFVEVEETRGGGAPLAHKDMFYRAGRAASCGSKILRGWIAGETS